MNASTDIERARREHQVSMRNMAKFLIWVGVFFTVSSIVVGVAHDQLAPRADPSFWVLPAMFAVAAYVAAVVCFQGAQPIPNEPLHAPAPVALVIDQEWRKPTRLRFLERLKNEFAALEQEILDAHKTALEAYERVPQVISYSEYRSAREELDLSELEKENLLAKLPSFIHRIERVASGDVGHEILDIKERIKKMQRERQEEERRLAEAEKPCNIQHTNADEARECDRNRRQRCEELHELIHGIDKTIIELETDLEELQNFDFQQLWASLELPGPPNLTRIPKERLDDLRDKVNVVNEIPNLRPRGPMPGRPLPSIDEQVATLEARRARYRQESADRQKNAVTPMEKQKWKVFFEDMERELDEEVKKLLRRK